MSKTEFSVQFIELPLKSRPWEVSLVDPSSFPVLTKFHPSHIPISLSPYSLHGCFGKVPKIAVRMTSTS